VILRVIRGRASPEQVESLRAALDAALGPGAAELAGPTRFHFGTRPVGDQRDVLVVSFWTSAEAARRGDERDVSPLRIVENLELHYLEAAHFEIDATILRHSNAQPIALRMATGRFSKPGSDIEMQDLLRRRAPLIGDEMTEAYVGRRIMGRAVEVVFVSAWQRIPVDRRLEDTFWPDMALRYDHFEVEVYTALSVTGG
jgi:hypothetical protein